MSAYSYVFSPTGGTARDFNPLVLKPAGFAMAPCWAAGGTTICLCEVPHERI